MVVATGHLCELCALCGKNVFDLYPSVFIRGFKVFLRAFVSLLLGLLVGWRIGFAEKIGMNVADPLYITEISF